MQHKEPVNFSLSKDHVEEVRRHATLDEFARQKRRATKINQTSRCSCVYAHVHVTWYVQNDMHNMICTEYIHLNTYVSCQKPMQHSKWVGFTHMTCQHHHCCAHNTRLACAIMLVRLSSVLTYCGAHGTALTTGADFWVCVCIWVNGGPKPTYSAKYLPWVVTIRKKKLQKQLTMH